jgi:hypothetical protein
MRFGKQLPSVLLQAGFTNVIGSASYDSYSTPAQLQSVRDAWVRDRQRPEFINWVVQAGLAERSVAEGLANGIVEWARQPGTFWALCGVEALGWKSSNNVPGV